MNAHCLCKNGHNFISAVIEDDWSTNSFVINDDACPECGTDEFTITETTTDYYEDGAI